MFKIVKLAHNTLELEHESLSYEPYLKHATLIRLGSISAKRTPMHLKLLGLMDDDSEPNKD